MNRIVVLWLFSLLTVAGLASVLTAQSQQTILSGSDLDSASSEWGHLDSRSAPLMVRVNGKWVEAGWATKVMPAK